MGTRISLWSLQTETNAAYDIWSGIQNDKQVEQLDNNNGARLRITQLMQIE